MSANEANRCTFTYRDGRRCRMLCPPQYPGLCLHHWRSASVEKGHAPPAPPPLVAVGALDNPWAVRRTLKRVFGEVAAGRINPGNAAVMAHIGRLLLFQTRRPRRKRRAAAQRPNSASVKQ
jgi:hypothetical protein